MAEGKNGGRFHFVGHHLWLDFVNTQVMENGRAVELLRGFDDLLAWCEEARPAGLAPTARWAGHPDGARVFARAMEFRGRLRDMADALTAGRPAPKAAVDFINEVLREGSGYEQLVRVKGVHERRFHMSSDGPSQLLVPVAESAAEVLSDGDPSLVRKCESPLCILYFYDNTKNHARRWCSMSGCGNRAKAAAHYRRKRGQAVHRCVLSEAGCDWAARGVLRRAALPLQPLPGYNRPCCRKGVEVGRGTPELSADNPDRFASVPSGTDFIPPP